MEQPAHASVHAYIYACIYALHNLNYYVHYEYHLYIREDCIPQHVSMKLMIFLVYSMGRKQSCLAEQRVSMHYGVQSARPTMLLLSQAINCII